MLAALARRGVSVEKIKIRGSKTQSIDNQLQNLAFQDPEIKYLAQRVSARRLPFCIWLRCCQAFVSYMRSVHLHKDKTIFKVTELPAEAFAASLGLAGAPKIKFLSRENAKEKKNASRAVATLQAEIARENEDPGIKGSDGEEDEDEESKMTEPHASWAWSRRNMLPARWGT